MYNPEALDRRKCTATRLDGKPCRAFAVWHNDRQLCSGHLYEKRKGHGSRRKNAGHMNPKRIPCTCKAYPWPHRPGGGKCEWPREFEGGERGRHDRGKKGEEYLNSHTR